MIRLILLIAIALLTLHRPAFAYLDPGSAAMITQMIMGCIAAAGVFLSHKFQLFRRFFGRRKKDEAEQENDGKI